MSPSSRRAWIEIQIVFIDDYLVSIVALLAEGVDRNIILLYCYGFSQVSPSSRRAWIEIQAVSHMLNVGRVALLAEGVDRNRSRCISSI